MPAPLFDWTYSGFSFLVDQPIRTFVIGEITSVRIEPQPDPVAEPSALALLVGAAVVKLARRRRVVCARRSHVARQA